jgi:D-alanine-D-alanine ligase
LKTGPAKLTEKVQQQLASASKEIYRALGMNGYARLDYRLTEAGDAYLLEANPNPQIAKDEDFAKSAMHIGISYPELIDQLLQLGMRYVPSRIIG